MQETDDEGIERDSGDVEIDEKNNSSYAKKSLHCSLKTIIQVKQSSSPSSFDFRSHSNFNEQISMNFVRL